MFLLLFFFLQHATGEYVFGSFSSWSGPDWSSQKKKPKRKDISLHDRSWAWRTRAYEALQVQVKKKAVCWPAPFFYWIFLSKLVRSWRRPICREMAGISRHASPWLRLRPSGIKGEVRTINDRNICERRSCMKNNGKSPTIKFVSGEERHPSEVQRVSRDWRLSGATHSSADLTWIRKLLEIQAPKLSELEGVELELGSCCSDLDKQVSDEICRTRKRPFEIPFRL